MAKMSESEYQRLRADYMRGDIDSSQARHTLEQNGYDEDEAQEIAHRWNRAKHRKALGDGL